MHADNKDRQGMPEELCGAARQILRDIWHWNYVDWEAMEPLVTGPMARLLRNNMAESEEAPTRDLRGIEISEYGFLEDGLAWVKAAYTWQEAGEAGSETMVWIFKNENGRWKACSVGREIPKS